MGNKRITKNGRKGKEKRKNMKKTRKNKKRNEIRVQRNRACQRYLNEENCGFAKAGEKT